MPTEMIRATHGGPTDAPPDFGPNLQGEMVTLKRWALWARVRFLDARGASMVEYALLIGLVALVVIAAAIFFGDSLVTKYSDFGSEVQNAP